MCGTRELSDNFHETISLSVCSGEDLGEAEQSLRHHQVGLGGEGAQEEKRE